MKMLCSSVRQMLVVCCIAAGFMACASRNSEPVKGKMFRVQSNEVADGQRLYMQHCHKCHPAGEAGLGPSINRNPAPQFVKRFQVRHGLGVMPAFSADQISKDELHSISEFLVAWRKY